MAKSPDYIKKQLPIPGLEPSKRLECVTDKERITQLEARVLNLELEVALLRIQMEGEKEHA